jgi:hypothetical protein
MARQRMGLLKRKGYIWVTLTLFLFSIAAHWAFGWEAYKNEQRSRHEPIVAKEYVVEMVRDTAENWQSEFLQLIWQVAGLAFLLYAGSPQSKEGDERKEEKLDYLIRLLDAKNYSRLMQDWDEKYPRQ